MAVPKKRTGHSAQGKRRANWKASKPATTKCPNCGETVLTHTVCTACGYYKGKQVSKKAVAPIVEETSKAEEVKEEKSAKTKKTSSKAKSAEVVEEVKEEVKAEEKEEKASEE